MTDATVVERLLYSYIDKIRGHADELYKLVKESNPDALEHIRNRVDSDQKRRLNSAAWHGHEINKYAGAAKVRISKMKDAE